MLTSSLPKESIKKKWIDLHGSAKGFDVWFKNADHAYGKNATEARQKFAMWEYSQLGRGQHWESLRDNLSDRITKANKIAEGYINNVLPSIYARNNNAIAELATESAIDQGIVGIRFDLVDERTVKNLMTSSSEVKPYKPVKISLDKDTRYSKNKLQNALLQGILQGDAIDKIANRFEDAVGMSRNSAIRNARTACTGAQNAGKQDRFEDLQSKGCSITKVWDAANDSRTREEHRDADGQEVDVNDYFDVGGEELMYPADPSGSGWNIYNCRCAMHTGKIKFHSILTEAQRRKANFKVY